MVFTRVLPFYPDLVLQGAIVIVVALKLWNRLNLGTSSIIKVRGKLRCDFRQQRIELGGALTLTDSWKMSWTSSRMGSDHLEKLIPIYIVFSQILARCVHGAPPMP